MLDIRLRWHVLNKFSNVPPYKHSNFLGDHMHQFNDRARPAGPASLHKHPRLAMLNYKPSMQPALCLVLLGHSRNSVIRLLPKTPQDMLQIM